MKRHIILEAGAIVRVKGFAPAKVLEVFADEYGTAWASVRHTEDHACHGYSAYFKKGEVMAYRVHECPPRDIVRDSEQRPGSLFWPSFKIRMTGVSAPPIGAPSA